MSEYAHDISPPKQSSDDNINNDSLEDAANNSIIGKVKSRVSSIIPNRLTKWFSPSAKLQNESLNGSICGGNTPLPTRRRRRIEIEEEDNFQDDELEQRTEEYEEKIRRKYANQEKNRDCEDDNENDEDDDSQNSDEEYNTSSITKQTKRDLNVEIQPPLKRSRLHIDARDSPLITRHQPLLSSTPAMDCSYLRNSASTSSAPRSSQRFSYLNLYANHNKIEPAFNFGQQKESKSSATKKNTDIIDLISSPSYEHENKLTDTTNAYIGSRAIISSRKSLNLLPSSTSTLMGVERVYANVSHLKRQPLSSGKANLAIPLRRTSTTIQEVQDREEREHEQEHSDGIEESEDIIEDANLNNGRLDKSKILAVKKRQKLNDGASFNAVSESNEAILVDSASESGESDALKINSSDMQQQRKTGVFNMSASGNANTRNSSRTSSFGNGLNFYSHLEGRKSLFSGPNNGKSNPLNNSTLSLTSLNRRQFNASIYGSTSALSDSRLLNTFSPFYKGKTTYGGAAAYNKYTAGASSVRIAPTLIRPTMSLSTQISTNTLVNNLNSNVGDNSTISSTAKRILDLINDFSTPLSEAKKMASSLRANTNLQIPLQAKGRLNESDLNASRAMRLSQVRTPYSRPAVILQPSGNANGRGIAGCVLPPIKELQVPTMSQLLQMKKIQNTTEKSRKITQISAANTETSEYTLPEVTTLKAFEHDQQKHINKIKKKVTNTLRPLSSKDLQDEEPPPPVNLPNITFPLMHSVPKIDIELKKPLVSNNITTPERKTLNSLSSLAATETVNDGKTFPSKTKALLFNPVPVKPLTQTDCKETQLHNIKSPSLNIIYTTTSTFKFSEPLKIVGLSSPTQNETKYDIDKYKFSPPLDVIVPPIVYKTQLKQPQLKEGSCLDALSKPFTLSPQIENKTNETVQTSCFGNQFKKSPNDWECESCMVLNKLVVSKCVACETPRKENSQINLQQIMSSSSATVVPTVTISFGEQFKKSSNEWDCDACMVRNKQEAEKCVACETPRKSASLQSSNALPHIKSSFIEVFKPMAGKWECKTCMISNKNETSECIACQTKKPVALSTSSVAAPTKFKFGFGVVGAPSSHTVNANINSDAGFQTLAAQQRTSKWECDACLTRNDANRTKCACCEQPKPGTSTDVNNTSIKFQFGATAASKFKFGFDSVANAPKEDVLQKELVNKTEENTKLPSSSLGFGATNLVQSTQGAFLFGIKPLNSSSSSKKDDVDTNKKITNFGFRVSSVADVEKPKVSESTHVGFISASMPLITTTVTATTISTPALSSSTSTDINEKSTFSANTITNSSTISNIDKPTCVASSSATSTTVGFSFSSKTEQKPSTAKVNENKTLDTFYFKTPTTISGATTKSSGFVIDSSVINGGSTTTETALIGTNNTTTASTIATSTTTAAVKSMFSSGSSASATPALNTQATATLGGFSFESNSRNNVAVVTTTNSFFAAATSTSSVTATANAKTTTSLSTSSTTTTTPASTNIFGSFGGEGGSCNTSTTPIFGSSFNSPANNNSTTVSSSTNNTSSANALQFEKFASKTTSNVFGSFGGVSGVDSNSSALVKPNETKYTLPVFGNAIPSSTSQSSTQFNSGGFMFGSNAVTTASIRGSVTSTSTTWPKNSFVFGSTTAVTPLSANVASSNSNESKEVNKPSVFSPFGLSSTNSTQQQQTSSIFGSPAPSSALSTSASGPTNSSTNLFGTSSAQAATSIFGINPSGNAVTPAPAFGLSPFGGAASSTSATPTFGSTAASGNTTFGGFSATSSNTTTNSTEVKKPEAAFNFCATTTAQSTSGGFNFGSAASSSKPAFNFGGTSTTQQPTFNFTGTAGSQNSTKPFQFGATPSAPVFNFNHGALEGTPNAPFQFNAGIAPVSSNIFAPAPTPGTQTAQQAKRKVRAPIRRATQR